jgi:hypothetical protein
MTRVFAFIGGPSRVGQSTIAAELAFEWVKRGASACILTTRRQIEPMGFDCFELPSLAPPDTTDGQRDLATLAADLAQLEDYDYFILDLPSGSADLAIAAGLSGADLVVPMSIEQGALSEVSGMFKQIARRPPPRPLRLVLNQVRNPAAATDAAERLISSIEEKLKLPARLAATLPWDPDLATLKGPSALLSMTQPTAALVRAIAPLADDLDGNAETAAPLPVAMVFWEQFQTLLQQPIAEAAAPLELSDPVQPPAAPAPAAPAPATPAPATPAPATAPQTAVAPVQMVSAAPAPELAAHLDRIATSLEQLNKEVARLRSGLAGKFEFEDDEDGEGRREGAGEPIHLDFESFRRVHSDGKIKE